jgi:threonine dehydratase
VQAVSPRTRVIGAEPAAADDASRSFHTGTFIEATRFTWERMKIVIEPSSAVPLAAIMEGKLDVRGMRVAIVLSGGNVDLDTLPWTRK